ncbi:hypothetical protein BGZ67_007166 [Mortierella alpina]|nr:hypothetical protein BGZ67_007166 [Mortierella alpina]
METLMRMRVKCDEGLEVEEVEEAIEAEIEGTVIEIRWAFFQMRSYTCAKTMYERSEHPPSRSAATQ